MADSRCVMIGRRDEEKIREKRAVGLKVGRRQQDNGDEEDMNTAFACHAGHVA